METGCAACCATKNEHFRRTTTEDSTAHDRTSSTVDSERRLAGRGVLAQGTRPVRRVRTPDAPRARRSEGIRGPERETAHFIVSGSGHYVESRPATLRERLSTALARLPTRPRSRVRIEREPQISGQWPLDALETIGRHPLDCNRKPSRGAASFLKWARKLLVIRRTLY